MLAEDYGAYLPKHLSAEAKMSILVASPSTEEVYTYYGHAGFRVQDEAQGLDLTFNYGIFSFTEDFLYRFVEGKTDYLVVPQRTAEYMAEYLGRGSAVTELKLRLDSVQQGRAWHYLLNNIRPENRSYRYLFFEDNCATRPVAIVEQAVGALNFKTYAPEEVRTYRQEVNELEASSPWLVLGTDLALSCLADRPMLTGRDYTFSPRQLEEVLKEATLPSGASVLLGVEHFAPTLEPKGEEATSWLFSPFAVFTLLFLIVLYLHIYRLGYRHKGVHPLVDCLLLLPAGVGGLVLFYISVLSEHHFVAYNLNLWFLNPLYLLFALAYLFGRKGRKLLLCYHFANFVSLLVFVCVAYFLPQHFNLAIFPLALSLMAMSWGRIAEYKQTAK